MYDDDKRILIIAGPNGAGKTTFAVEYLPNEAHCPLFVNADLIAAGLSPFDPATVAVRAGRVMLEEIRRHVRNGETFAFETTLSGRRYSRLIPLWQRDGYHIQIIFLQLANEQLAIERVAVRVAQGGHGISEPVIRRRFKLGLRNFHEIYRPLLDSWQLYDNSGPEPRLIEEGQNEAKTQRN